MTLLYIEAYKVYKHMQQVQKKKPRKSVNSLFFKTNSTAQRLSIYTTEKYIASSTRNLKENKTYLGYLRTIRI